MAAAGTSMMSRRLTVHGHNLLVDVIDKEKQKPESRVCSKRHPAQDVQTPGKVLAVWGTETEECDLYAPYFSNKPMNVDGELMRMRHRLGVVSHRGHKPEQPNQDEFFVLVRDESLLMGVLDGHGTDGHNVAHFAQEHLPSNIMANLRHHGSWEKAVRDAVNKLCTESEHDEEMKQKAMFSGTTMTVIMLDSPRPAEWRIRCAHLGDSIAVLARRPKKGAAWEVTQLTDIHRPDREDEAERISKAGGTVLRFENEASRLAADEWSLAVSRSWGDFHASRYGLSHDPEFTMKQLAAEGECFILVCSDGVWDVMPQLQAVNLIGKYPPDEAQTAVEKLVSKAQLRWQEQGDVVDDITALVLWPAVSHGIEAEAESCEGSEELAEPAPGD